MTRLFACLCLLALSTPSSAERRPMTVDDLMKIRNVGEAVIGPDGVQIVYVVSVADLAAGGYNSDLWLISTTGGTPVQLTHGPRRDDTPRWSPDGKSIAFLSDRDGKTQIWLLPIAGGEARRLTNHATPIKQFAWSPDGSCLAFTAAEPETDMEKKRKEEKNDVVLVGQNIKKDQLHLLEIATGKVHPVKLGGEHVVDFSWSPDGKQIAYSTQPTPSADDAPQSDIHVVSLANEQKRVLVSRPGVDAQPRWSPDGKQIAFLSHDGKEDWVGNTYLCVVAAEGGTPRNLTKDFDERIDPAPASGYEWSADSQTIYFTADQRTSKHLFALQVTTGEIKPVTNGPGVVRNFSVSPDGGRLALVLETAHTPPEVYTTRRNDYDPRPLTRTNPQLIDLAQGSVEVVTWKSKDGLDIEGLLMKPAGWRRGTRVPLLTYVHGGPAMNFRTAFTPYGATPQSQRYPLPVFAGLGYAVFCPNPRGSNGYGEKFRKAVIKDWGGRDLEDILTGVEKLVADGVADPDRLGLMGWSYGGFMTSWAITQTDRFKAASAGAGVTHPASMFGVTDIPTFMVHYYGASPWEDGAGFERCSVVLHAGKIRTPTLIQHGDKDERVPLSQSQEFYVALKRQKVPVEFAIYPRSGHNVSEPRLQSDLMQRNVEWFQRWLKK